MDFMKWNEGYLVEVATIDAQHEHLVGIINGMAQVFSRGSQKQIIALLEDLRDSTRSHFDFEEELMARAGYVGLVAHRQKHAMMKTEVNRLLAEASNGNVVVSFSRMSFFKNWLAQHINEADKAYLPALKMAGLAEACPPPPLPFACSLGLHTELAEILPVSDTS